MNLKDLSFRKRNRNRKRALPYLLTAISYLLAFSVKADDGLFSVFPSGYLSEDSNRSIFISNNRGTYLGSADEDGQFIALGNGGSAFGRINQDGSVLILYSPVGDSE
jgi:hypothetical protein